MPHYLFGDGGRVARERYKTDYIVPVDGDLTKVEYIDTSDDGGKKRSCPDSWTLVAR